MPSGIYKRTEEHNKKLSEAAIERYKNPEERLKVSERVKGKNNPMFGKCHSEETKRKLSEAHKGKNPHLWSEESRKKLSETLKGNKYCLGRKCSEETKRKISKTKKGKPSWNKGKRNLAICGEKNPAKRPEVRKKISETKKGEKNPQWQGGISFLPYTTDWTKILKIAIRKRDHYTCQLCNKKQKNITFNCHHIDYNKKNCNPDNLITLCRSCHIKTNSNRNYWIEFFKKRSVLLHRK